MGTRKLPEDTGRRLPRSPSGRIPQWVLDEQRMPGEQRAAGPEPTAWRQNPTYGRKRPRRARAAGRRRLGRKTTITLLVLALCYPVAGPPVQGFITPPIRKALHLGSAHPGMPTPGYEFASKPLGVPPAVAVPSASHRFLRTSDDGGKGGGKAIAYDPCRPIHYVTRAQGQPAGGPRIVAEAVARVSSATGLKFVDDGPTDEAPSRQRPVYQRDRYGDRWAPVLIAWETPTENPDFSATIVGEAGSNAVGITGGPSVYVTGEVQLNAPRLTAMLARPDGSARARAVVQHELGHLVGLGHVDDRRQLMFPESGLATTDFGAGDLTGLAALGRGPCVPQL